MEALARIHQLGGRGRIVYLRDGGDTDVLRTVVADLHVWRGLTTARIGLAGRPSDWLVASAPTPRAVRDAWGPQVVTIDLQAAIREVGMARTPSIGVMAGAVVTGAGGGSSQGRVAPPADAEVLNAAGIYPWLRTIVERERLDAIAVRCFDLIVALRTSSCLAFAYLNDEGIVAGCEGDLVSTVAMLWLRRLVGEMPWMANPVQLDPTQNVVRLAHCTVPLSSVRAYRLRTHFESGTSVGIQGDLPPGPVTLVRVGGVGLRDLWVVEGDGLPTEPRNDLCRTQLDVRVRRTDVGDLLTAPLGNHIVTIPGHHAERVRTWWSSFVAA
jgi:L-fucose isomerase-like protein